jgi:NAD(P)-dependent dehydrogenase (short-subunit alcohol dehydrogenase family)
MKLKGSVVLVTGAGSGIGAAIVRSLARKGARIVLASRNRAQLRSVVVGLPEGTETMVIPTDVGDEAQVKKLIDRTVREFGTIDGLVNSAGFGIFKTVVDLSTEEFDDLIRANLRGPFLCMKYALPYMYEQKSGTVVTISSLAGKHGFANGAGYCASKFGVMGLMESVFHEARSYNVRLITVAPGSVATPFFEQAGVTPPDSERVLHPEDVAAAVMMAFELPRRALIREIDIRPTNPRG